MGRIGGFFSSISGRRMRDARRVRDASNSAFQAQRDVIHNAASKEQTELLIRQARAKRYGVTGRNSYPELTKNDLQRAKKEINDRAYSAASNIRAGEESQRKAYEREVGLNNRHLTIAGSALGTGITAAGIYGIMHDGEKKAGLTRHINSDESYRALNNISDQHKKEYEERVGKPFTTGLKVGLGVGMVGGGGLSALALAKLLKNSGPVFGGVAMALGSTAGIVAGGGLGGGIGAYLNGMPAQDRMMSDYGLTKMNRHGAHITREAERRYLK